ncbi:MAG: nucleotidyltransferase substrate binding protein [Cellulosilyticaceae bacterium]
MRYDIRWKQRYSNFSKALLQLTEFLEQPSLNKFELQGLIQCFEYTFELGWKTMKDYLEAEGLDVKTPRSTIQTGFQIGLISNGHAWIDALEKRNLMAHTYNESLAQDAEKLIRHTYFAVLKDLHGILGGYL